MDIRKKYTEETGKLYYKEATLEFEWDGDYVEWLEQNLVKLFAIPAVIKSVCDDCTAYPFDERGKTPLCKTCKHNPKQTVL